VLLFLAFKGVSMVVESKVQAEKLAQRGAVVEERVGEILARLNSEHLIIHDVRCQFGDVEHIVFSKNHGVFLIETIAHGSRVEVVNSKILVNGNAPAKDLMGQTLRNTNWLTEELRKLTGVSAKVNSLVVLTNAFVVTNRAIMGITITNRKFLLSSIQRLGKPLPPEVWAARETLASRLVKRTEQAIALAA
jgi:hypothetical protein